MAKLKELDYVIIDLETTGLYVDRGDRIIEIGAIKMKGDQVLEKESFHAMVDPEVAMSPELVAVHGITNDELKGKPKIIEVAPQLQDFISGCIPIAQNARFDLGFLRDAAVRTKCHRLNTPFLDTMLVSKTLLFHYTTGHGLDAIAKRLNVENKWARHRSIGDCLLTGHVWAAMIHQLELLGRAQLKDVENCFVSLPTIDVQASSPGNTLTLF